MKRKFSFTMIEILIYTIVLGTAAGISHFAYDLTGELFIIGLFNPVNDSVWEHMKFMFFPFLIWWAIIYVIEDKKYETSLSTWIVSAAISLVVAPSSVMLLFYTYRGALGIASVWIDILLAYTGHFIALCLVSHLLKHLKPKKWMVIVSVIVVVTIFIIFIVFTISPPDIPVFIDYTQVT